MGRKKIYESEQVYNKEYYESNKVKLKERHKIWRKNNPDYNKQYRQANPDKIKGNHKKYRDSNPHAIAWRGLLYDSLRRLGKRKETHTIDVLGYSAIDFKNHITSLFTEGMSWDNYGEWHIDHIKQVCTFGHDESINVVNALSNLRPLWATTREINGVIYEGNLNREKF